MDKEKFNKEFKAYLVKNEIIPDIEDGTNLIGVVTAESQPFMEILVGTETVIFKLKLDDEKRTVVACTVTGYDYLFDHY